MVIMTTSLVLIWGGLICLTVKLFKRFMFSVKSHWEYYWKKKMKLRTEQRPNSLGNCCIFFIVSLYSGWILHYIWEYIYFGTVLTPFWFNFHMWYLTVVELNVLCHTVVTVLWLLPIESKGNRLPAISVRIVLNLLHAVSVWKRRNSLYWFIYLCRYIPFFCLCLLFWS